MYPIFQWLSRSAKRSPVAETKQANAGLVAFHSAGTATWSDLGGDGYARNGFCRNPVVYRCVRMISEAAASLPMQVQEGRIQSDEHPALELLARPNERQSGPQLMDALYGHLLISGNAYLHRIRIDDEDRELHVLDPARTSAVLDDHGWPVAYEYRFGSRQYRYDATAPAAEVLHLSLFNPVGEVNGLSPLAPAHMALDIHNAASVWNKALLDNSARPSGALVYAASSGDNLTEEQFDRLKSELEEGCTGATRAGRPMLLEGGLDWKAMGFSPRDMDFLQAKNGAAREIALAFGVPPMLLGIPGDNTYSNYQEANRAFWRQTVLPLATRIVCEIGNWLSPPVRDAFSLAINTDHVEALAPDREVLWARIGAADFLTEDEKREALGFTRFDDETGRGDCDV